MDGKVLPPSPVTPPPATQPPSDPSATKVASDSTNTGSDGLDGLNIFESVLLLFGLFWRLAPNGGQSIKGGLPGVY